MQLLFTALFASAVAEAGSVIRPPIHPPVQKQQESNSCCFGLESVGVVDEQVEENHFGSLSLGGPFQQGGFCFDKSTKTIKDTLNHNCFMRSPTEQFQCYVGIVGNTAFDISPPGKDGKSYLTYDNGPGAFYACPVGAGADVYYNIFSASKPETTGCISVTLSLYANTAGCFTDTNATVPTPPRRSIPCRRSTLIRERQSINSTPTSSGYSQVSSVVLGSSMTPVAIPNANNTSNNSSSAASPVAKPSKSCSVSPSAPSLAPVRLTSIDKSAPDGPGDSSAEAHITIHNNTVLEYAIPDSFFSSLSDTIAPLCALQFRMPICSQLPEGYPCYNFSGLEQEVLSNSGMNFELISGDGQADWNGTALHQVFPGKDTIIGTFECGRPKGSYGLRSMTWLASSVRNFGLEFLHAGVGNGSQFSDGIGAWIVPCQ